MMLFCSNANEYELDNTFTDMFLLSYRCFTTSIDVLKMMEQRWKENDASADAQAKKDAVNQRIVSVLLQWMMMHFPDFKSNPEALIELKGTHFVFLHMDWLINSFGFS